MIAGKSFFYKMILFMIFIKNFMEEKDFQNVKLSLELYHTI